VDHQIECRKCGVRLSVDPTTYEAVEKIGSLDLSTLEHVTNPNLRDRHAKRLVLDAQLRRSSTLLTPETRREWMLEPFRLLNPRIEQRFVNSTQLDRPAGVGCIGTILVTIATFWIAFTFSQPMQDNLALVAVAMLVIGTLYTFVQLHFAPGRFVQRKIAPVLIAALRPLQPTQEELQEILLRCKTVDMRIAKQFKADRLWLELQRTPDEALTD